jgi:amino acid transporter
MSGSVDRHGALTEGPAGPHRLRANSIGLLGVLFLLVGSVSPIQGVLGNVPLEISIGNGVYAPGGYLVWIVGLLFFAVGYAAITKRLVSTGGFFSYISQGLGPATGLAAGWCALAAYAIGEAGLFGTFSYFAANSFSTELHLHLSWVVYAVIGLAVVTLLSYFDISVSAKLLGVLGMCELLIILIVDVGVIAQGGAHGLSLTPLNPAKAFTGPSPTVGLLFAFLSWVGFEVIPNYAEETSNPRKNISRGLYLGVVCLGAVFILSAWAGVVGHGVNQSVNAAGADPANFYYALSDHFLGGATTVVMKWLVVTSTFACVLVWHQTTSRYFYALGREGLFRPLGRTHHRWKSPHVAALFQGGVVLAVGIAFIVFYKTSKAARSFAGDFATAPYAELFAWLLVATTLFILMNEVLCSIAVIKYFWRKPKQGMRDWLATLVCPAIATVLLATMLVVSLTHVGTLGGDVSFVKAIPAFCLAWFVIGLGMAGWLRVRRPAMYTRLGMVVSSVGAAHAESGAHSSWPGAALDENGRYIPASASGRLGPNDAGAWGQGQRNE